MSIRVMAEVWDESEQKGGKLLLLLALSDFANDEGVAWPSVATLSKKCRATERTVQRQLQEIESDGELRTYVGGFLDGRNQSSTYRVLTSRTTGCQNVTPSRADGAVVDVTPRGDASVTPPGDASVTPYRNHQVEPSKETPAAETAESVPASGQLFPTGAVEKEADAGPDLALEVWNHYFSVFGDKLRIKEFTDARRRAIQKALKATGDNADVCKRAVDGLRKFREQRPGRTELSVIFETGPHSQSNLTEQIEYWASHVQAASFTVPHRIAGVHHQKVKDAQIMVARMLRRPDDPAAQAKGNQAADMLKAQFQMTYDVVDGKAVWKDEA